MSQKDLEIKIGEAWKSHYGGKNQDAVDKFLQLANEAPANVDIYWGLGLSYRNLHRAEQALEAFRKVKSLVTDLIENESGELGRYFMLNRMVDQQIHQMEAFLKQTK
jgi:hypothetical protein